MIPGPGNSKARFAPLSQKGYPMLQAELVDPRLQKLGPCSNGSRHSVSPLIIVLWLKVLMITLYDKFRGSLTPRLTSRGSLLSVLTIL